MWQIEKLVSKGDYIYARVPSHTNSTKNGYVLHHRIVMENHIGRLLTKDEIVHHKDHDRKNNVITNLDIMTNSAHAKMHGLKHGRKMVKFKCPNCKNIFSRRSGNTHLWRNGTYTTCSRKCSGSFSRLI